MLDALRMGLFDPELCDMDVRRVADRLDRGGIGERPIEPEQRVAVSVIGRPGDERGAIGGDERPVLRRGIKVRAFDANDGVWPVVAGPDVVEDKAATAEKVDSGLGHGRGGKDAFRLCVAGGPGRQSGADEEHRTDNKNDHHRGEGKDGPGNRDSPGWRGRSIGGHRFEG